MLSDKIKIISRNRIIDERGWFVKTIDGTEEGMQPEIGEVYVTAAQPGKSKGGDYSISTNKWFTVIEGCGVLKLEDINTKENIILSLDGNTPVTVYVPNMVANIFINKGDIPMVIVAYADKRYDRNDIVAYKL